MKKSLSRSVLSLLMVLSMSCRPARRHRRRRSRTQPAQRRLRRPRRRTGCSRAHQHAAAHRRPAAPVPEGAPPRSPSGTAWPATSAARPSRKLANDFNASQDKCYVEPIYQGSYDDSLNKLKAGLQTKDMPAVVQLFDIGTRLMVDLKVATPVQDFIDKEKYDVSDLEPNVLAYYTVDGKQWSMPFNTSNPMLYYNKDMFKAAGLDPEKPPRTFAELADYAAQADQEGRLRQGHRLRRRLRHLRLVLRAVPGGLRRLLRGQRQRPRRRRHQGHLQQPRRRRHPRVVEEDVRRRASWATTAARPSIPAMPSWPARPP